MTIEKLIDKLKNYPQDTTVKVWNERERDFMPVTDIFYHKDELNEEVQLVGMW